MQTFQLLFITLFSISSLFAEAKTKKETIKVWGNCGMCQSRIEKAAKLAGASSANWDVETHILTVSFDETKTSLSAIESKIASVGHDTKNITAPKDVYNKLHGCCQYERKDSSSASVSCCDAGASCCTSGQACCTKTSITGTASKANCCVSGAACCGTGKDCCAKAEASAAKGKDCCNAGAACCVPEAACCDKTAKIAAISNYDCCAAGGNCCNTSKACCLKKAN